jgi:hypothetical protein
MNYTHPGGFLLLISILTIVGAVLCLFLGSFLLAAFMVPIAVCHVFLILGHRWAGIALFAIYIVGGLLVIGRLLIESFSGQFSFRTLLKVLMNGCIAGSLYRWLQEH